MCVQIYVRNIFKLDSQSWGIDLMGLNSTQNLRESIQCNLTHSTQNHGESILLDLTQNLWEPTWWDSISNELSGTRLASTGRNSVCFNSN